MTRRYITALLLLALPFAVRAQDSVNTSWEFAMNGGYMIPNNSTYSNYSSATFGADVTYWKQGVGSDYWRWKRAYPSIGLRLSYAHIPNSIAGDRFGLVNLIRTSLASRLDLSIGLGLSVYTKPRSLTGDTNNIFIGSLINCLIDIGVSYRPWDDIYMAFRILHTSNGMLVWPNMGLNYLQFDLGYRLPVKTFLGERPTAEPAFPATYSPREWSVALSLGTVMSRDRDFEGYYPCYDLSLYYQHNLTPVFSFGGAVDLWYNYVDKRHLDREEGVYKLPLYVSAMGMMELFWGRMSLKAGAGPVIVASPQVTTPFYERVGGYYNFGHNYMGVALNAHGGRIEFIEWTFGHRFPIK